MSESLPQQEAKTATPYEFISGVLDTVEINRPVASRRYVRDRDGHIQDVRFFQEDAQISLRGLCPGDYSITVNTAGSQDEYKSVNRFNYLRNAITIHEPISGSPLDKMVNLAALHEGAHGYDFYQNRLKYLPMLRNIIALQMRISMAENRDDFLDGDPEENLANYKHTLIAMKSIQPDDLHFMTDRMDDEMSKLKEFSSTDEVEDYIKKAKKEKQKIDAHLSLISERQAWAHTLKQLRHAKAKGINLFGGSREDLVKVVNACLRTYEDTFDETLDDKGSSTNESDS